MPSPNSQPDSVVDGYLRRGRYKNAEFCKRDILVALKYYRGLYPKFETFVFGDGQSRELLCLDGTIPVPYKGLTYNIPICIWILDTHPQHAPLCYVKPTSGMQIKISQIVDVNGKVYLPYLHEWNGSSEIVSLIQLCIITFGEEPPVYAKPVPVAMPHQPPYPPASVATPFPSIYPSQTPAYPPQYQVPYPPQNTPATGGSGTVTQEHLRASLQSAVEDKIRRALADDYATKQVEIQSLLRIQHELKVGQDMLKNRLERVDAETRSMSAVCGSLKSEKEKLQVALDKFDRSQKSGDDGEESSPDKKIVTTTPLFRQIVDCYAEELALTDAIYYLSEALRKGIIDCDAFLKQVRDLSRKQFFLTATMQKAREKAGLAV